MSMTVEELLETFHRLKRLLQKFENPLRPKFDLDSKYDLWSFKEIQVAGRKRTEIPFASIIIQSQYVGLYYMPIYTDTELKATLEPELLKLLKGKSCFHIRTLNDELTRQIEELVERGYQLYRNKGWI